MFSVAKKAAFNTKVDAVRFAEADVNCDGKLDWDEFRAMHAAILRDGQSEEEVRRWFHAADADGNGEVSINEFFLYSLSRESSRTKSSGQDCIRAIFQQYDVDGTGTLDKGEFRKVALDLGFGALADDIFDDLDNDASGFVQYDEVVERIKPMSKVIGKTPTKMFVMSMAWTEHDKKVDLAAGRTDGGRSIVGSSEWALLGSGWSVGLDSDDAEGLARALRDRLRTAGVSVVDLLKAFNSPKAGETSDGSDDFEIDPNEFAVAMRKKLGYRGPNLLLTKTFALLDMDGSGKIGFDELFSFILGRANHVSGGVDEASRMERSREEILESLEETWSRLKFTLEQQAEEMHDAFGSKRPANGLEADREADDAVEPWTDGKLRMILSALLKDNGMADIDLLRACDKDENVMVSKKEWLRCMKRVFVSAQTCELELYADEAVIKWDEEIRPAILSAFVHAAGTDNTLSCAELATWLAKGRHEVRADEGSTPKPPEAGRACSGRVSWRPPAELVDAGSGGNAAVESEEQSADAMMMMMMHLEPVLPFPASKTVKALVSPRDFIRQLQQKSQPRYPPVPMTELAAKQIQRFGAPARNERALAAAEAELLAERRYWALKRSTDKQTLLPPISEKQAGAGQGGALLPSLAAMRAPGGETIAKRNVLRLFGGET